MEKEEIKKEISFKPLTTSNNLNDFKINVCFLNVKKELIDVKKNLLNSIISLNPNIIVISGIYSKNFSGIANFLKEKKFSYHNTLPPYEIDETETLFCCEGIQCLNKFYTKFNRSINNKGLSGYSLLFQNKMFFIYTSTFDPDGDNKLIRNNQILEVDEQVKQKKYVIFLVNTNLPNWHLTIQGKQPISQSLLDAWTTCGTSKNKITNGINERYYRAWYKDFDCIDFTTINENNGDKYALEEFNDKSIFVTFIIRSDC